MSRKSYKRSDKCELVYTPVSWNVMDDEQKKDLEFIEQSPNKARKIRECVRMVRNGLMNIFPHPSFTIPDVEQQVELYEEPTESEQLSQLVD